MQVCGLFSYLLNLQVFSDDADTPATSVEISFVKYKYVGFWDFPETPNVKIIDTKFVFYGPQTPLALTKHGFIFEEDEKAARVYKSIKSKHN